MCLVEPKKEVENLILKNGEPWVMGRTVKLTMGWCSWNKREGFPFYFVYPQLM